MRQQQPPQTVERDDETFSIITARRIAPFDDFDIAESDSQLAESTTAAPVILAETVFPSCIPAPIALHPIQTAAPITAAGLSHVRLRLRRVHNGPNAYLPGSVRGGDTFTVAVHDGDEKTVADRAIINQLRTNSAGGVLWVVPLGSARERLEGHQS